MPTGRARCPAGTRAGSRASCCSRPLAAASFAASWPGRWCRRARWSGPPPSPQLSCTGTGRCTGACGPSPRRFPPRTGSSRPRLRRT